MTSVRSSGGTPIGNCEQGRSGQLWATQQYPADTSATYIGGYITGGYGDCGWIEKARTSYQAITSTPNCAPGTFSQADTAFIAPAPNSPGTSYLSTWTHWVNPQSADAVQCANGACVSNKNCNEYANFWPWRSGQAVTDVIESVPASGGGSTAGYVGVRYLSKYTEANTGKSYYMIHNYHISAPGNGTFGFMDSTCLNNIPNPGTY